MPEDKLGNKNNPTIQKIDGFFDSNSTRKNQPMLIDLVTLEKLAFQTIPNDMSLEGESSFTSIEVPGRNNPLYHFTGSEDVLKFTLSWYANHDSREDVIRKCTWIRSLTKSDGYSKKPHEVKLIWGDLFKQSKWIVEAAPFKLAMFDREVGLLPRYAIQEITLKRVINTNMTFSQNQQYNF